MCGIAGILNLRPGAPPVRAAELELMAAKLAHRGPDGSGVYVDPQGRCGLAFRRLAIIDLVSGAQPLANENGRIWVAFNGEIYNFRALRNDLERVGHHFSTQSDSEVLVHLYEQYGADGCRQLAGMFAFACWDEERGRLILVRDRFGKKPLHYAVHDSRLYFASELKAILALPGMPRRLVPQALHEYLIYQYVPAPHAIYAGFRKLPPGHLLEIEPVPTSRAATTPRIDDLTPRAYWCLDPAPFHGSYAEALDQLNVLLRRAVERRLVADVPLGAFLSGGLDSSIVVALMVQLGVRPLRTFSMGFTDPQYDETRFARQVAAHFGTEHHEHLVVPEAHTILAQLAWHYDEPFADSSAIPTYYVSHWTRQHVTVALTGDGGDELFAGYDRYRAAALAERFDLVPGAVRRVLAALAGWLPHAQPRSWGHRAYRFAQALASPPADRYLSWVNVFPPALLATGYRPEFAATLALDAPLDWFRGLYVAAPGPAANRAIRTDFASYLPFDLLTKVDIAAMACGLECRAPFLDHELASFAAALPLAWRLKGGGKHILRDWAADKLPPAVLRRPKMGFGVPVGRWFRAELRDTLRTHLLARDGLSMRIFRPEWLTQLVEGHLSGRANYEHALWALLMLEYWQRQWAPLDLADLPCPYARCPSIRWSERGRSARPRPEDALRMIIEQSDIDALLAEAGELAATAAESFAPEAVAPVVPPARPAPPRRAVSTGMSAALQRVLRLRVPVIVRLAQRPMPISAVRDISVGSIIEFEKSVEDRLDLLVNNRLVGHGQCVKVGENFGLRLSAVISPADRVRTLGE